MHKIHQNGVSLIELMVSLVIGSFLIIGATTVYVNSRKSYTVDDNQARLQETARYALSVLETDIRQAGYWGLHKDSAIVVGKAKTTDATSPLVNGTGANDCINNFAVDSDNYLIGSNNQYSFNTGTTAGSCDPESGSAVTSADTITARRASANTDALDANKLQVCSTPSSVEIIHGGTCPSDGIASSDSEIHDLIVRTYYVDQESSSGNAVPSLRRKDLISGPTWSDVEVIPGVEDLQIQFGWDPTGGTPDSTNPASTTQYLNPDNATLAGTGGQVVAVRIWLLLRAETQELDFTDTRTYSYGDRTNTGSTTDDLTDAGAAQKAYAPNDHYRRLLVSRTIFLRNAMGT